MMKNKSVEQKHSTLNTLFFKMNEIFLVNQNKNIISKDIFNLDLKYVEALLDPPKNTEILDGLLQKKLINIGELIDILSLYFYSKGKRLLTIEQKDLAFLPTRIDKVEIILNLRRHVENEMLREKARKAGEDYPFNILLNLFPSGKSSRLPISLEAHNYILNALKEDKNDIGFDSEKGALYIKGKKVNFTKGRKPHTLLTILFSKNSREWNADQLYKKYDKSFDNTQKVPSDFMEEVYQIARQINIKVHKDADIKNFLIYDFKSIQINEDYL